MTADITPSVIDYGPGDPVAAVVAEIHGDEPSGVRAERSLLSEVPEFRLGVKFIHADPPAFLANERYLDVDLNRVFPGDPMADARSGGWLQGFVS